jgi:hypothetical protein
MATEDLVFISYAREDESWAERLYMDLRKHEINAWLDVRCLAAGANWQFEIKRAIRDSRYFILLISKYSINKRGFVQKEMKEAIDVLQEFPKGTIFLIPARLDRTEPIDDELRELNWVNLTPDYHDGLARILSSLASLKPAPLTVVGTANAPTAPVKIIDKGREITVDMPLILGPRAAVSYAPFRTKKEFLQQFVDRLPAESIFSDKSLSYYFTLDTKHEGILLGDDLKAKHPEYITLVLQNAFRDLNVRDDGFSVILTFGGVERTIAVPYDAIQAIRVPEIDLTISFESMNNEE